MGLLRSLILTGLQPGDTGCTQEANWVEKEDYDDDLEGVRSVLEAATDSGSFVVQQWGVNGEEEE